MAMNKLERIEKDIEKTKGKIAELQKQLRELEAAKTEQENLQIVQLVRGLNMTPEEFAALLDLYNRGHREGREKLEELRTYLEK